MNSANLKKQDLTKNTLLLATGTLMTKGLQFIMMPFFSRWLSTEDFGRFDLLCTYVALLIPVLNFATGEAIFRFSVDEIDLKKIKEYISGGFVLAFSNFLIFSVIALMLNFFRLIHYIIPFLFLLMMQLCNVYLQSYLRAVKKLKIYSISNALTTLCTAISVSVLILVAGMGLDGIIYGYALGYFCGNVWIVVCSRYWTFFSITSVRWEVVKKLIRYSLPLVPNDLSWWVLNASDRQIINIFLGASANGVYAIAHKIPGLCSSIFSMFGISWQQSVVENISEPESKKYFNDIYNKMVVTLISTCIGLLSVNFILFHFIFDIRYVSAENYAPILITAIAFSSLSLFFGGIQIGLKRPKENGISTVAGAVVNLLVHLGLIKIVGLYAAAISTMVANLFVMWLRRYRLRKDIIFCLEKKSFIYIGLYFYFIVSCYLFQNALWLNVVNLLFAVAIFIKANIGLIGDLKCRFFTSRKQ